MSRISRPHRRRSITIAPNLVHMYDAICDYYGLSKHNASAVFNLCLHTVGKALANKLSAEQQVLETEQQPSKENRDGVLQEQADSDERTGGA